MSTPKPWWDDLNSRRPGPARIRVTFNREFTEAEREHLRRLGGLIGKHVGDKFRVSPDDFVYVESNTYTSRALFEAVSSVVANAFVNVFPTAVRTFRELVPAKVEKKLEYAVKPATTNTAATSANLNVAYEPRTQARPSTVLDLRKKLKKKEKAAA